MTTTVVRTAEPAAVPVDDKAVPRAAAIRGAWRLIRRGTLLMWLATATYMAVEVVSFRSAYPDQESRQKLLELSSATAVRMLQGVPGAIDHAGAFAVWDGGWMLALIVACWALLTATRLTRGEEDSGRAELLLSRPVTPPQVLMATLSALAVAVAGVGVAAALPFVLLGEPAAGAVLWGCGVAAFGAVMVAIGALCAQVMEPRRRAVALGLGAIAALFLLRIVANSSDSRGWLLALTPFGWLDRLSAFSDDHWLRLSAPLATAAVVAAIAVRLSGRRDSGAAVLRARTSRRSRVRMLGSAAAFGWRTGTGALIAWSTTLFVSSVVFGLMVGAIVDFIEEDDTYRRMLESMGMDMSSPVIGFLSYMALFMALPFAAFVAWRIGALRQEEADGRLDNLLVRGVVRWRWLTSTALLALVAGVLVAFVSGLGLWLGAELVDAPVTAGDVAEPMLGTLPLIALFTGMSVLVFAVAPRLTIGIPVTLAVVGYLLDTFGQMLEWPGAVLAMSPFHHLARLPSAPMTGTAIVVMTGLGLLSAAAGIATFSRRDLQGA